MKFVMFYHSLLSDWNHGNAHFLRGVVSDLLARGHDVQVYEPADNWSLSNLRAEFGDSPLEGFRAAYPGLTSHSYDLKSLDLNAVLDGADVVLVHEWSEHQLVAEVGRHRKSGGRYVLLFHDTHHRAITEPTSMGAYDLSGYDGVLAFGRVLRDLYLAKQWAKAAWTWHEAADVRVFKPLPNRPREGDLVWIGNWGDNERTAELHEFLIEPIADLKLKAKVHGVRYPQSAIDALSAAGIEYGNWAPNYTAPKIFARYRVTVHVPRRPYTEALPGIPTIRPFEALACGIPLISAPWNDAEHLFTPGEDFFVARNGQEMRQHLRTILNEPAVAKRVADHGLATIRARHTCTHRVDELLSIVKEVNA